MKLESGPIQRPTFEQKLSSIILGKKPKEYDPLLDVHLNTIWKHILKENRISDFAEKEAALKVIEKATYEELKEMYFPEPIKKPAKEKPPVVEAEKEEEEQAELV